MNVTEAEYSSSGLCMLISPVCPLSLLLRACDESDKGEGKACEGKRECEKEFLKVEKRILTTWREEKGFLTSCDTSLQNRGQTGFLSFLG